MRQRVARWFGVLAAGAIVASFMVLGAATPASAAGESTILSLINRDRAANNLGPLRLNAQMNAVALSWATSMAAKNSMVHNPSYSSQIPAGWTRAGENIAHGYPTPAAVHDAWMHSAGHRANILGDYTDVGIAFVTVDGMTWAVEDFAKYGKSAAPAKPKPKKPPASPTPSTQTRPVTQKTTVAPTPKKVPVAHKIDLSLLPDEESSTATADSAPDDAPIRPAPVRPAANPSPGDATGANLSADSPGALPSVAGFSLGGLVLAAGVLAGVRLRRRWRR